MAAQRTIISSIVFATFAFFTFFQFADVQAISDMVIQDFNDCKEENNMTESDLEQLKNKEIPDSRAAKCFLACIMTRLDMMDGPRLNPEGSKGMISQIEDMESDDREKLMTSIDECATIITYGEGEEDECENAVKISMCISDKAVEKGVKPPT
uniref:Odorant-binding protein 3 n=1 Tax=Tropidothorax elegans TaxID=2233830 RepID=A0A2Z5EM08_9HEMI|nr:odorant-binding protein 3 [Tropidothorax elegans]